MNFANLSHSFTQRFGEVPNGVATAPGRVNLIGEHTDYNGGLVLPMAIDRSIKIVFGSRNDDQIRLHSVNFDQTLEFTVSDLKPNPKTNWADYVKGVVFVLQSEGHSIRGFDATISGDIPLASGLSSSAALEVATLLACEAMFDLELGSEVEMAKLAQQAENEFVGVQCGLMDQLISAAGRRDHAMAIDFSTHEMTAVPVPNDLAVIVGDTKLSRKLAGSTYNQRRTECEQAIELIATRQPEWKLNHLSDIAPHQLKEVESYLPNPIRQRVRHVVRENERVRMAVPALVNNDHVRLGQLLLESHISLRDDYEVSSIGLNQMVEAMQSHPACYGAKLTGAGFGGCTVAVVQEEEASAFLDEVASKCRLFTPRPELFKVKPNDGGKVKYFD